VSNGVRGERHASKHGMFRGVKPADDVPTFVAETNRGATPVTHADERNLCPKRRKYQEVKWLTHLTQKGTTAVLSADTSEGSSSRGRPA